jgi:hypothetical protein
VGISQYAYFSQTTFLDLKNKHILPADDRPIARPEYIWLSLAGQIVLLARAELLFSFQIVSWSNFNAIIGNLRQQHYFRKLDLAFSFNL